MEPHNNIKADIIPTNGSEDTAVPSKKGLSNGNGIVLKDSKSTITVDGSPINNLNTGAIKKKRDEKRSKRDQRSWDNLFKSISSLPESEKLEIIKEKYTDLYNEFRSSVAFNKAIEKQLKNIKKEKDHIQVELVKNMLSRSKLESLARELQKQNKDIKEENYNRLKEEEEKRKEVAANFTEKLNTLTQLMDENKDKSMQLRDDNLNMTSRLTELYQQFQERENHVANINRQMELQKQLSETQLKKREFEFETEQEIWKKEKAMLIANLESSQEANKILQDNVNNLQEHLNSYQKQYSDFEVTMKRSNLVFDAFKDEMSNMHRVNSVLEKDRNEWHSQWKSTTQKCLSLSEELQLKQKKLDALEKLCRKLNVERSNYLQQLKLFNITPVTPADDEVISSTSTNLAISQETPTQQNSPNISEKETKAADLNIMAPSTPPTLENNTNVPVVNTSVKGELKILTQKLNEGITEVESNTTSSVQLLSSSEHLQQPIDDHSELASGVSNENFIPEPIISEKSTPAATIDNKTEELEASITE